MTLTEIILARAAGKHKVVPGEIITVEPDVVMTHDHQGPMAVREFENIGATRVWNPNKVVIVLDHRTPTQSITDAENHQLLRKFTARHKLSNLFDVGEGICHDLLMERGFAAPGRIIIASDSHVLTLGALGAFATGVGSSELAVLLVRGNLWLRVPETIKVVLTGKPAALVSGKDIVLRLLEILKTDGATYKAIEFHGPGLSHLGTDHRMTLCNMCLEMGAKNAIIPPDQRTLAYLKERGVAAAMDLKPDPNAEFCRKIEIDLARVVPLVAKPHSPDHVAAAETVAAENVAIDQALIGTCTNGRYADLRIAAEIVSGKTVHPGVRFLVAPATRSIYLKALQDGFIEKLVKAGAMVATPCCGPCGAYGMGAMATDETCITTGSRNFVGRLGSPQARIYLGSSATVAASAIAGKIVDPRMFLSNLEGRCHQKN